LSRAQRIAIILGILLLALNSAHLAAFADPSLVYVAGFFLHLALGTVVGLVVLRQISKLRVTGFRRRFLPAGFLVVALLSGGLVLWFGGTRDFRWLVNLHGILGAAALLTLGFLTHPRTGQGSLALFTRKSYVLIVSCAAALFAGGVLWPRLNPDRDERFVQLLDPPLTMAGEGLGEAGPFFPSAAETSTGGLIPSDFFMKSEGCGQAGCHPDIYKQWYASAHHFSSFNNQWYRKSIEYMQDVVGTRPSKWCAGCHDHAVFFNGRFDLPIRDQIDTPEAQAGLACTSCHSIVRVKHSMGNGGFVIRYPPLHELASSENPILKWTHDFFVKTDPEPHRRTFIRDFHKKDSAEFCSTCHKVHLDSPVNHYRWIRGFNEYDAWQASGVSGQGARSFYYPPQPRVCADCHMALVESRDAGNIDGMVHNHRFIGANTALPTANRDQEQLRQTVEFLKNGQVTIDIFGISRLPESGGETTVPLLPQGPPRAATQFAEVEEMGLASGIGAALTDINRLTAPLGTVPASVHPGESVRVEVVVRTRGVGHFFPGGTVDAFDVWLELKAEDASGQPFFWSGFVEDGGKGPVEKGGHRYRSFLLDERGNPINKRNAWAARTTLYVRLIPPGAADTVHFRLRIPEGAGPQIRLTAKLNYRKFSWWNTQWSYAGVRDPAHTSFDLGKGYDSGRWIFAGDTQDVSGAVKQIPDLPIVVMAADTVVLPVEPVSSDVALRKEPVSRLRERWNDYGIGLLLQGDLRGAEAAFLRVTELDPRYADGYVNVARCRIQVGDTGGAQEMLRAALERNPTLASAHYFYGLTWKTLGQYGQALEHFGRAAALYPRDRAVLNEIGRIRLLQRNYADAIAALRRVLDVDPEDLQAHYNLMLAYRGAGDMQNAEREQKLYERFKTEEAAQSITGEVRRLNPEDNNERQRIHEHLSVPLPDPDQASAASGALPSGKNP